MSAFNTNINNIYIYIYINYEISDCSWNTSRNYSFVSNY